MKLSRLIYLLMVAIFISSFLSVKAESVEPSKTRKLKPGQNIAGWFDKQFDREYFIQRLTERTYIVMFQVYNSVFYVGDEGVFVLSPTSYYQAPIVQKAIAEITELPVTAVMYSHSHQDHITGSSVFLEAAEKAGRSLRIIATDKTKRELERYPTLKYPKGFVIPQPTDVLATPFSSFYFEELKIDVYTPEDWVHSVDSSIIHMPSERLITAVDIIEPQDSKLPFIELGEAQDLKAYRYFLNKMLELDWDWVNGGHFNLAGKDVIRFFLTYLDDIESAVDQATIKISKESGGGFASFYTRNRPIVNSVVDWVDTTVAETRKMLEPKYGHLKSFPAVIEGHIIQVIKERGKHDAIVLE